MARETTSRQIPLQVARFASLKTVSGLAALCLIAIVAAAPVPDAIQAQLCILTIATYFVMGWLRPTGGPFRVFVALLIIFTSTRYMIWRVTETMPSDSALSIAGASSCSEQRAMAMSFCFCPHSCRLTFTNARPGLRRYRRAGRPRSTFWCRAITSPMNCWK